MTSPGIVAILFIKRCCLPIVPSGCFINTKHTHARRAVFIGARCVLLAAACPPAGSRPLQLRRGAPDRRGCAWCGARHGAAGSCRLGPGPWSAASAAQASGLSCPEACGNPARPGVELTPPASPGQLSTAEPPRKFPGFFF